MSEPRTDYEDPVHGAICQIISGISALNMEPEPLKAFEGPYTSQRDRWVKHSVGHLNAAVDILMQALKASRSTMLKERCFCGHVRRMHKELKDDCIGMREGLKDDMICPCAEFRERWKTECHKCAHIENYHESVTMCPEEGCMCSCKNMP